MRKQGIILLLAALCLFIATPWLLSEAQTHYRVETGWIIDLTKATIQGTSDNIPEGATNKYLSDAGFNSKFAAKTTDSLTEGATNKYFSGKTTDNLPEGSTNKYFSGKTLDDLPNGTSNVKFGLNVDDAEIAFGTGAGQVNTDDIPEGAANKYNPFGTAIDTGEITDGTIANVDVSGTAAISRSKLDFGTGLVSADISATAAITESKLSLNYATHSNANDPTADQKAALAGTSGTPSATNKYVTDSDARLSGGGEANTASNVGVAGVGVFKQKTGVNLEFKKINAGGSNVTVTDDVTNNEIDVNVSGVELSANKNAASGYAGLDAASKLTGSQQVYGTAANTACAGNDSRLSDARTPTGAAGGDLGGTYPNPTVGAKGLASVQVFTTSGTWTKPTGITKVIAEVVSGGGGGGGSNTVSRTGAGGGGGGYSQKLVDVSAISSVAVTVGGGGGGGAAGVAGDAGSTSSFGTHASATGGGGGANESIATGGAGGTGSDGNINITGQNGFKGGPIATTLALAAGGNTLKGFGGQAFYDAVGGAGVLYGGGGGGGWYETTGRAGGVGAAGIVIVWEFK